MITTTIYATFTTPDQAQKAAGALLDNGVRSEHISIVFPEGYQFLSPEDNVAVYRNAHVEAADEGLTTTTAVDGEAGAAKGARFGLVAGALAALAAVFIPGIGLVIGGGALALAVGGVAGATAAGAVAGGVTGYLKDQGVSETNIEQFGRSLESGGAMISVSPTDEIIDYSTIEGILVKYEGSLLMHGGEQMLAGTRIDDSAVLI